jgi:hypothetical protein
VIKSYISLGIALLLITFFCAAQNAHEEAVHDLRFSMSALKASEIALKQFESEQPKADPKNFTVFVREFDAYFEINFLPNRDSINEGTERGTAYIIMPNPHGNKYGYAVGYEVSKKDGKVLNTFYSK